MAAKLIDGKLLSQKVREEVSKKVEERKAKGLSTPGLAVVLVGNDPASAIYVRNKHRSCEKAGIFSKQIELLETTTQKTLLQVIDDLNKDKSINGILVQLPLPKHINSEIIIESVNPKKDVDGFHPYNFGHLAQKNPTLRPCTPWGMIRMLKETGIELEGKNAIVVGRSNIVGLPMALELLMENCTVTVCHSRTKNLATKVKNADIVVAAIGRPEFIKGDWIKKGAIVLDAGINRLENGKLVGDVEFDKAKENAEWITPVPGGVGPMTIAMLLQNTLQATELQNN